MRGSKSFSGGNHLAFPKKAEKMKERPSKRKAYAGNDWAIEGDIINSGKKSLKSVQEEGPTPEATMKKMLAEEKKTNVRKGRGTPTHKGAVEGGEKI